MVRLRLATVDDSEAIRAIYNYYVEHSTCTYQLEPDTAEQRRQWLESRSSKHPVVLAEADGEVIGWGSLSPWNVRAGYNATVEFSVYVRYDRHRKGLGRLIVEDLIERAKALGHHTILGGASSDQTASIRLQEALGFEKVAHLKQVGKKFGRWLDVVYMQLMVEE